MKEINEANAVLSDAERRAAYDQLLARGARGGQDFEPPPGWDAGFEFSGRGFPDGESADFSDFFAELFGRMGGARAHAARASVRSPEGPGTRPGPSRQDPARHRGRVRRRRAAR